MDARARLRDMLDRLDDVGIHADDRDAVTHMVREVLADERDLARVQQLCDTVIVPHIGHYDDIWDAAGFPADTVTHRLGRGVLPMCALLATADDVITHQIAHGAPEQYSRQMVHDLGQQVMKDRQVNGSTGLHNQGWLRGIWRGGFLWIGRLQFELTRSHLGQSHDQPAQRVLSVHIPEVGPLRPDDVDACLAAAPGVFEAAFPEAGPIVALVCHSWLLDPQLADIVPGANMADFASRWRRWHVENSDRDAYYFGFGIEPDKGRDLPYGLDELAYDTRLHRAMVDLWRRGGHFQVARGFIAAGQVRDRAAPLESRA